MLYFTASEPIKLPTRTSKGKRTIDIPGSRAILKDHSAAQKRGCYIYSYRGAKGQKPLYVGMTKKQALCVEPFTPHKIKKLNSALKFIKKGSLILTLVYKVGSGASPSKQNILDLETWLIQTAYRKNPSLANDRKLPKPKWTIRGVINHGPGHPGTAGQKLRRVLGLP